MDLSRLYATAGKTAPQPGTIVNLAVTAIDEHATVTKYEAGLSREDAEAMTGVALHLNHPAWCQLTKACNELDLAPAIAWDRLGEDRLMLVQGDITIELLTAFCKALVDSLAREQGERPGHYTQIVECEGCGPVWLWAGAPRHALSCPWCHNRRHNLSIPRAVENKET